jgi:raffinose/stachyose/melibiose transport system permease protein
VFRYTWRTAVLEAVLVLAGLLFVVPFVVLLAVAFRNPDSTVGAFGLTWPPSFGNLVIAWNTSAMGSALANSLVITVVSVALIIVLASAAAYPLSRYRSRWSRGTYYFFLFGLLVAGQASILPLYTFIRDIGLMGTIWAVVLIQVGANMPFSVFLYTGFLRELPRDYEEAAILDGCGRARTFVSVVFPLARPITGTILILTALGVWNDFFTPLLYLSGGNNKTAPLTLYDYVGQYTADWPLVFSTLLISILPVVVLYVLTQRFIIKGFASGLKG